MEIERKFLINQLPDNLHSYKKKELEQGYLNTDPVVRIRKSDQSYELTYKSAGLMSREEYNLPINEKSYLHLKEKCDGLIISKTRYLIPIDNQLVIELDIFHHDLSPLILAEVEFPDEETACNFVPPLWFGKDVTFDGRYHNNYLSKTSNKV